MCKSLYTLNLFQCVFYLRSQFGENIIIGLRVITAYFLLISQSDVDERHIKNFLVALTSLEYLGIGIDNIIDELG